MSLVDRAVANSIPLISRPVVRRIASRYMAGDHLEEAIEKIRDLSALGCVATVDVLGESTESERDSTRRLKENPKIARYVARDVIGSITSAVKDNRS